MMATREEKVTWKFQPLPATAPLEIPAWNAVNPYRASLKNFLFLLQ